MRRSPLLLLLLAVLLLTGCAAPRNARLEDRDNALKTANSWEVNRAIMLAAEDSNNLAVALNAGEQELEARPDNNEARIILARLQSRAGRPEQALGTLAGITGDLAHAPACQLEKARAQIASAQPEQALAQLNAITDEDRTVQREKHKLRGVALDLSGRHRDAQATYRELLAGQEDLNVRYNYGRSLVATADFATAAGVLIPLVDNPAYPQARVLASGALMRSGDTTGARSLLEGYLSKPEIDALLARNSKKRGNSRQGSSQ